MIDETARDASLKEANAILDQWVRPAVRGHGGSVAVTDMTSDGCLVVEFGGACRTCPLQAITFTTSVRPALKSMPGIRGVQCSTVRVSQYAIRRLESLIGSHGVPD